MPPPLTSGLSLTVALGLVLAGSAALGGGPAASGPAASETGAEPVSVTTLAEPGPYATEVHEVEVPRPGDEDGQFRARLYIPLWPEVRADADDGPTAPVVAFGHGYLAPVDLYETTLEHLASWGIVVIAPRSSGELFPDHEQFSADLATAASWVADEGAQDAEWPGLAVDPEARGVSGHSMGGGAAVLAAAADPRIRTVATLAAAETRPSAIAAVMEIHAPALFLAASDDGITPVDGHQRPMFGAKSIGPAQLRIIEGGSHCGFLDTEILAGLVCDVAAIDVEEQRALSRALLTAWFLTELAGDRETADVAWPTGASDGTTVEAKGAPVTP